MTRNGSLGKMIACMEQESLHGGGHIHQILNQTLMKNLMGLLGPLERDLMTNQERNLLRMRSPNILCEAFQ